jgi:pantothenate kinase type III
MQSGAFFGLLAEIKSRVELYEEKFGETEIVLSGGNCFLFEKHLKKALFAHQYLTLFGLNKILTYNV